MKKLTAIFLVALFILLPFAAEARKIGYKLSAKETAKEKAKSNNPGSFRIDIGDNTTEDSGLQPSSAGDERQFDGESPYSRADIEFSGYDKKLSSSSESFFITNRSNRTMTAVELTIDYLTLDGRQLNKKFYRIQCNIPPGETRIVDLKSWDTQHSFHYEKSAPARSTGTPFTVKFYPSAFYLKY